MSHVSFCGEKVRDDVIQCFSQGMTQLAVILDRTAKQAAISHLFRDSKTQTLHDVALFILVHTKLFSWRQFISLRNLINSIQGKERLIIESMTIKHFLSLSSFG